MKTTCYFTYARILIKTAVFGLCLLPLAASTTYAQTVLNENFNTTANGSLPTDWYRIGGTTANPAALDGELRWGYAFRAVVTTFDTVTLAKAGDFITASFDARYTTAAPSPVTTGASLALYNSSGGSAVTADTASVTVDGHVGYKAYKAFGVTGALPNDFVLYANSKLSLSRFTSNTGATVLQEQATGQTIALNTSYTLSLKIERKTNDDLLISYSFGNNPSASYTVAAASVSTYTFDEIAINLFAGDNPTVGFLDNVLVETNVGAVPEPATVAFMMAAGMFLFVVVSRRTIRRRSDA